MVNDQQNKGFTLYGNEIQIGILDYPQVLYPL